jgi:recombinational DNA repair protein RecR
LQGSNLARLKGEIMKDINQELIMTYEVVKEVKNIDWNLKIETLKEFQGLYHLTWYHIDSYKVISESFKTLESAKLAMGVLVKLLAIK